MRKLSFLKSGIVNFRTDRVFCRSTNAEFPKLKQRMYQWFSFGKPHESLTCSQNSYKFLYSRLSYFYDNLDNMNKYSVFVFIPRIVATECICIYVPLLSIGAYFYQILHSIFIVSKFSSHMIPYY